MDQERTDATIIELSTVANDIEDFIDENETDDNSVTSVVNSKISKIEDLRKSCRNHHNELRIFVWIELRRVTWKR